MWLLCYGGVRNLNSDCRAATIVRRKRVKFHGQTRSTSVDARAYGFAHHSAACCSSGRAITPGATESRSAMMSSRTAGEEPVIGGGNSQGRCGE